MSRGVIILYIYFRPRDGWKSESHCYHYAKWNMHQLSISQNKSNVKKRVQDQLKVISARLIDKNPFHAVGDRIICKVQSGLA